MIFSVVKSPHGVRDYAPWCVFVDGREIINGIENEAEAQSIIQLLRHAKPKTIPAPKPRFIPRQIEGFKLIATRKLIREQPKEKGSVLLEFCLILPIFLLLTLGGFDLCTLANSKSNLDFISQQIALCTKAQTCPAPLATAQNIASGFGMNAAAITATAAGNVATVAYTWQGVSPFFSPTQMQSTATAQ